MKKILSVILILVLLLTIFPVHTASAAVKLNKTKITLNVGDTYKLKLTGTNSAVTWSSSDKSVATVSKGTVKAICGGSAVITAKSGSQKYKCTVTVKDKKTDVIYAAYNFDDSSIEDYAKTYKKENPDIIDAKAYDDEHILVTMWESKRKSMLKELNENIDEYFEEFIKNEEFEGVFSKIKADKLLQNIKVYVDKEKYDDSYASIGLVLVMAMVSDTVQGLNLIDPKDREYNITFINKDTGEIIE